MYHFLDEHYMQQKMFLLIEVTEKKL
jgi:hypothetical protein